MKVFRLREMKPNETLELPERIETTGKGKYMGKY